jgi:hypothetical protein
MAKEKKPSKRQIDKWTSTVGMSSSGREENAEEILKELAAQEAALKKKRKKTS